MTEGRLRKENEVDANAVNVNTFRGEIMFAAAVVLFLATACAGVPDNRASRGPPAMLIEGAVRSILFPQGSGPCAGDAVCPGPVPQEYVVHLRRELGRAGFDMIDERALNAPVVRITANHVATTATHCTMRGALFIADTAIEVERTYAWPSGAYKTLTNAAGGVVFADEETPRRMLQSCLASFAKTLKLALSGETSTSGRSH